MTNDAGAVPLTYDFSFVHRLKPIPTQVFSRGKFWIFHGSKLSHRLCLYASTGGIWKFVVRIYERERKEKIHFWSFLKYYTQCVWNILNANLKSNLSNKFSFILLQAVINRFLLFAISSISLQSMNYVNFCIYIYKSFFMATLMIQFHWNINYFFGYLVHK